MGATHNPSSIAHTIAMQVVDAVAAYADLDPFELPPLYEAIDPDALDALIASMPDGQVWFSYAGQAVTVDSTGAIAVSDSITSG